MVDCGAVLPGAAQSRAISGREKLLNALGTPSPVLKRFHRHGVESNPESSQRAENAALLGERGFNHAFVTANSTGTEPRNCNMTSW